MIGRKLLLLTCKPGTGKTCCVKQAIRETIEEERDILVATPTGFLASTYSPEFLQDIDINTVHAAFEYSLTSNSHPEVNWDKVFMVDKVSMVSKNIMQHVISTVN
jgi:type II secretory pathway predicted ATPase ExeA